MPMIRTTVVKPHLGSAGVIHQKGAEIEIEETHFRALAAQGFVTGEAPGRDAPPAAPVVSSLTNGTVKPKRQQIVGEKKAPAKTGRKKTAVQKRRKR